MYPGHIPPTLTLPLPLLLPLPLPLTPTPTLTLTLTKAFIAIAADGHVLLDPPRPAPPRCTRLHPAPYPYPHQQALATIGTALLTHLLAPVKSLRHGLDDFKQVR